MSGKYPTLPNAPIKEALVDVRCKLQRDFEVDQFKTIGTDISKDYPIEKSITLHEAKIGVKDKEKSVITYDKVTGYRYESKDGTRIVQLRLDGFTFNRLSPCTHWNEIRDEAFRLWNYYKELAKPEFITRIALRYINNLNIPMPINDFRDYLTCPPEVPEQLPQGISSFFYRVVIPVPDLRITAIITQALESTVEFDHRLPIILDIDVYKFTADGFLEEDVFTILEKLRNFKNEAFFNSITEKLLETYQ